MDEEKPIQNTTIINIKTAVNVNPNATKVENKFYLGANGELVDAALKEAGIKKNPEGKKLSQMTMREMLSEGKINLASLQKEIMDYVGRINKYLKNEWKDIYTLMWARILDHEVFAVDLYDHGKQDCTFSRNLVGNIIHYLDDKGFYKDPYNASEMARALEGDDQSPIRKALRNDPDEKYCEVVDHLIEELNKE